MCILGFSVTQAHFKSPKSTGKSFTHLLCLILLLLLEDVSQVDELLHGLDLAVQVLQIHPTGTAVGLQQQAKPLTNSLIVHFRSKGISKIYLCIYTVLLIFTHFMYMGVCLHIHLCTMCIQYLWRPEADAGSPGAIVIDGCAVM